MNKQEVFTQCHEILGSGVVDECQQAIADGSCRRRCDCKAGVLLIEGEELGAVPDGVEVVGRDVRNCLGADGCLLGEDRPLMCKLAPDVMTLTGFCGGRKAVFYDELPSYMLDYCPLGVAGNCREEVLAVVDVLKKVGVWHPRRRLKFPHATIKDFFRAVRGML